MRRLINSWHHFGPLVLLILIRLAKPEELTSFFHRNAKVLPKQLRISLQDACPQCQGMIGRLGPGVNPHGLGPLQMDVTICASFGHFKRISVTIDTFSDMVWAIPLTSEGSHFVIRHLQVCLPS